MVILTSQSWLTRHHGLRDRIVIFGNFNNFLLASVQTFSYEIRFVNCIDIQKYARIISELKMCMELDKVIDQLKILLILYK